MADEKKPEPPHKPVDGTIIRERDPERFEKAQQVVKDPPEHATDKKGK